MRNTTFSDQLHDMWRTRPTRLPNRGPVAGVAAGIGYRYGVDPVLIRVAFVVSTIFGGAGIVLYLAGWLLLSQSGDAASPAESLFGKGASSESRTKSIVLVVGLAIAVSTMGPVGVGLGGSGLISTLLMLGGLWLLHQRQPIPPPLPDGGYGFPSSVTGYPGTGFPTGAFLPGAAPTDLYSPYTRLPDSYVPDPPVEQAPTPTEPTTQGPSLRKDTPTATGENTATTAFERPESRSATDADQTNVIPIPGMPPSWDPLGVAPFAWDLPEPTSASPVAVQVERRRSRLTSLVLGLAILAAAGAGAAAVADTEWLTPGRISAIALAVVGVGLVIGAFLRRGYGLLVITGPLIGFTVLASMIGPIDFENATFGESRWSPTTLTDLKPEYSVVLGAGKLDLRSLDLTKNTTVDINVKLGTVEVILPEDMNVQKNSTMFSGEVTGMPDGLDGGGDGTDGPMLTLDINSRFASVEVHRG
ncbi:PspC domain-containing protein [Antrihabitans spumae]|uniref:PspC domain-containing protein n=1 Tax=Antrihabitans spumae TaxID=3373370 RepID=A0ABW7K504_9NOCA